MPDAAPAIRGSTSRMAPVVIGGNVPPMPRPATIIGARKSCHPVHQGEVPAAEQGERDERLAVLAQLLDQKEHFDDRQSI